MTGVPVQGWYRWYSDEVIRGSRARMRPRVRNNLNTRNITTQYQYVWLIYSKGKMVEGGGKKEEEKVDLVVARNPLYTYFTLHYSDYSYYP